MADIPLEKKFAVLGETLLAQHFAWHRAAEKLCPGVDVAALTRTMWEVTGRHSARGYIKRLDRTRPLPAQVAASMVWSRRCMGEDAKVEKSEWGEGDDVAFVRHTDCPWYHWHRRFKLLDEDRPGCDLRFQAALDEINRALGVSIRFETMMSLPDGDDCCLRRLWVEEQPAEQTGDAPEGSRAPEPGA
jgi:hypothetical protein